MILEFVQDVQVVHGFAHARDRLVEGLFEEVDVPPCIGGRGTPQISRGR